ncbi:MAG: Crp/Fnr family transcriptional regulator [Cyclobacteriaceae bacterium]
MDLPETFRLVFGPDLLKEIESTGKRSTLRSGEIVLDIGQTIRLMPIIISGTLKVSRVDDEGREILLYYVTANESCAMSFTCCMQNHHSEIRAVAEDDVEMVTVPASLMDEWLIKYPSWKNFVMRTIHSRFNEMLKAIDQIAFQKLDERLVVYLKEKSHAIGSSLINLSHEQIANELASSRVVISRLLKKLENDKKVLLYRNQIKLLKDL